MDADDRRRIARFVERMATMHEGPPYTTCQSQKESPRLQVVTAANAAEFQQAPKKRGRKPKVRVEGNVVAFLRPAPVLAPPPCDERLCRRATVIAFGAALTSYQNNPTGEHVRAERFIAAAWAKLGYAPPRMTPEQQAMQLPLPEPRA